MKAEETTKYILDKVSPLFNKKGYVGTSMSEITQVVGMTKGAIYGNFENKESLAISAFEHNIRYAIFPLLLAIRRQDSSINKLKEITNYYRKYYSKMNKIGGCPLLRVGIDSKFHNPILFEMARNISMKLIESLEIIIQDGVSNDEFRNDINPRTLSREIFSIIEGSIYMSLMHDDQNFLLEAIDSIENRIINKIIA